MKRVFDITINVPLGTRRGTLRISENGGIIRGDIETLGTKNAFTGETENGGKIKFKGQIRTFIRKFDYTAEGEISGNKIDIVFTGDRYTFSATGEEIGEEKK